MRALGGGIGPRKAEGKSDDSRKSGARAVMEAFDEASALGLRADDAGYK